MNRLIYILTIGVFRLCIEGINCDNQDQPVCEEKLGLGDRSKITDKQISASSSKSLLHRAKDGRLYVGNDYGWCAGETNSRQWFQVDFNETKTITAVQIESMVTDRRSYITTLALQYSYGDLDSWHSYTHRGKEVIIETNNKHRPIKLPHPITTRLIRINPRTWKNAICLTSEFIGCTPQEDCSFPVGMENKRISDRQITASSSLNRMHLPQFARLHNKTNKTANSWGSWCSLSKEDDQNIYLQIDLLRKRNISKVATQGYRFNLYVTKYKLNYSTNGVNWLSGYFKEKQIEFEGNTDNDTVRKNYIKPQINARFIRFIPVIEKDDRYACMRVEIYECLPVKGSVPKIVGQNSDLVDTDKRNNTVLRCSMGGQAGIIINWYRKGVLVRELKPWKLIKTKPVGGNRMESTLSLYNVTIDENGVKYECRGQYPGVTTQFTSFFILLRVGVSQPPLEYHSKTAHSLQFRVISPYRLANITKKYEFEIRVVNTSSWTKRPFLPKRDNIYNIDGLQPWTTYEVRVTAVLNDGSGTGRTSRTERYRTMQGVSDPPVKLHTSQVNSSSATVTWSKPSKDKIRGVIKRYIVKVEDENGKEIERKDVVDSTSCTIHYLLPDKNYTVRVAIENDEGPQSSFSSVSFTTQQEITFTEPPSDGKPQGEVNLEKLNRINIDDKNAESVAMNVKNLTSKYHHQLNPRNISVTAEILQKIVDTNTRSTKAGDSILQTISNVLDVENDVLEESNSTVKFVKILEDFVERGGGFSKNTSNIKIHIMDDLDSRAEDLTLRFNKGSIIVIPNEVLNVAKNKTMYFIYYKNGNLFKRKRLVKEICTKNGFTEYVYEESTPVVSSGVPGQSIRNLSEKVIIKFHLDDPKALKESSACVYWDFDAAGGAGDWSNKGCTRRRTYNHTIECACDHMTNFAALVDVYAATSKACGVHGNVLTVVSYFGCILSIIGLSLTIFTYMFFRRLRKELAAKILIQLCIALLCVLVVFVVGIERSRVGAIGCYIVAVLLHYFILAAFLWMLVEAHFMYLAFVKVWSQHGEHELLKCSFIAWGLPAIVVGITMAVNLDNYGGGHYCRIEKTAFYAAFFAPVMCIIFVNLIVFGIIMYKLNTRPESSLGRDRSATAQRMKQAVGIMIVVGVTWLFGALAISGVRVVFQYLFVFFNSIQGFCIFVFYCLSQKNVRDSWKALLTCQLHKLHKDSKSFHTNTCDRRRCSTASTTHNTTLSLARKKTSTSSGNMAYPSHSMDTLNREFTSFNCTSGTLPGHKEGSKPNNLNNFVTKDCNVQNGMTSNSDVWKRKSNALTLDDETPNSFSTDTPLTRSHSSETLCSDDDSENYHSYDLVASSEGSLVSLNSVAESQASDNHGFYSLVNTTDGANNNLFNGDELNNSTPNTPEEVKRTKSTPLTRNNHLTVPLPTKRVQQLQKKQSNDGCVIPDDFGQLIVNPSRGSVRGVRGVVETSVDTYDEDSPDAVTPQGVRLADGLRNEQDNFNSNECIASLTYFAQNNRVRCGSKDRDSSTNGSAVGDVCL